MLKESLVLNKKMGFEPVPRTPITNADVTVGLGVDQMAYTLQPMVMPRNLAINIDGYVEPSIPNSLIGC